MCYTIYSRNRDDALVSCSTTDLPAARRLTGTKRPFASPCATLFMFPTPRLQEAAKCETAGIACFCSYLETQLLGQPKKRARRRPKLQACKWHHTNTMSTNTPPFASGVQHSTQIPSCFGLLHYSLPLGSRGTGGTSSVSLTSSWQPFSARKSPLSPSVLLLNLSPFLCAFSSGLSAPQSTR